MIPRFHDERRPYYIRQFWPLIVDRLLQSRYLLGLEVRIESLAGMKQLILDVKIPFQRKTLQKIVFVNPVLAMVWIGSLRFNQDLFRISDHLSHAA